MSVDMTGLSALVTGGASGIGLATARRLSELGASVAVLDLSVDDLVAPLRGHRTDVTDAAGVERAVAAAADAMGAIDILVNNAGVGAVGTVEDNPDEHWHRVFDVNVLGIVRTTRAALPYLRRSDHAAI